MSHKRSTKNNLQLLLGLDTTPLKHHQQNFHSFSQTPISKENINTLQHNFRRLINKISETSQIIKQKLDDLSYEKQRISNKYINEQNRIISNEADLICGNADTIESIYQKCRNQLQMIGNNRQPQQDKINKIMEQMEVQFLQRYSALDQKIQKYQKFFEQNKNKNSSIKNHYARQTKQILENIVNQKQVTSLQQNDRLFSQRLNIGKFEMEQILNEATKTQQTNFQKLTNFVVSICSQDV